MAEGEASRLTKGKEVEKRGKIIETIVEGRKMESYAEHRTKDMHTCFLCERICYKKVPGKEIGKQWLCIDCLRKLKEILDTLKQWEEELVLEGDVKKQLDNGLGV